MFKGEVLVRGAAGLADGGVGVEAVHQLIDRLLAAELVGDAAAAARTL